MCQLKDLRPLLYRETAFVCSYFLDKIALANILLVFLFRLYFTQFIGPHSVAGSHELGSVYPSVTHFSQNPLISFIQILCIKLENNKG